MVYSNVSKKNNRQKADSESASRDNEIIDLDNEVVIGLASFPKPNESNKKKKEKKSKVKVKSGQNVDKQAKNINKNAKVASKKIEVTQEKINKPITPQEKIKIQKRRALKKMGAILILLILIIGGLVYFFLSPVFNVKKINVVNNNCISADQIIELSEIKTNQNMFKFSKKQAKKQILTELQH